MPAEPPDIPGLTRFELIGAGGQGRVWKAFDARLDRWIAIKTVSAIAAGSGELRAAEREARAMGRLSGHPNVLVVYDVDFDSDPPYLKLELCRTNLERRLSLSTALDVTVKVAGALATAHEHNVVHGDVKPSNVLLDAFDVPKVADFGIARLYDVTRLKDTPGFSPAYVADEVLRFGAEPRSDVYSLGCTLEQWVTGAPPSSARVGDLVPDKLRPMLERARAPLDDRYESMVAFAHAVRRVQAEAGLPVTEIPLVSGFEGSEPVTRPTARQSSPPGPPAGDSMQPEPRRRPGARILVAVVVAAGVIGATWTLLSGGGSPGESRVAAGATGDETVEPGTADLDGTGDAAVSAGPVFGEVLFTSDRAGGASVWEVDLESGAVERRAGLADGSTSPSASSSGLTAFVDAEDRVRVTAASGPAILLSSPDVDADEPAVSPDGADVVFVERVGGQGDMILAGAEGLGERRSVAPSSSDDRSPAWSPDGTRIAFVSTRTGSGDVYVYEVGSSALLQVTSTAEVDSEPTWDEDGTSLIFVRAADGARDLLRVAVPPDGEPEQPDRLHRSAGALRSPCVSADGGHIVFEDDALGSADLFVVPLGGGTPRQVTAHEGFDGEPACVR